MEMGWVGLVYNMLWVGLGLYFGGLGFKKLTHVHVWSKPQFFYILLTNISPNDGNTFDYLQSVFVILCLNHRSVSSSEVSTNYPENFVQIASVQTDSRILVTHTQGLRHRGKT